MGKFPQSFEVYGFPIEVNAGVWPPSFKRFVKQKLESSELSIGEVTKTCNVSQSLVYKWRADVKRASGRQTIKREERMFSEVVFENTSQPDPIETDVSQITLRGQQTEISLPSGYPLDALVKIILALEGHT